MSDPNTENVWKNAFNVRSQGGETWNAGDIRPSQKMTEQPKGALTFHVVLDRLFKIMRKKASDGDEGARKFLETKTEPTND